MNYYFYRELDTNKLRKIKESKLVLIIGTLTLGAASLFAASYLYLGLKTKKAIYQFFDNFQSYITSSSRPADSYSSDSKNSR